MGAPVLYDSTGKVLTGYYQWDINQFITIKGLPAGCTLECHFAKMQGLTAYAVEPTASGNDFVVAVPNEVFQTPNNFYLFLYVDTPDDGQRTEYEYEITVKYRLKPEDYVVPTPAERATMRSMLLKAEGWAKGTHDGVPVTSGDEAYHNNAKYYSENAQAQCEELIEEHNEDSDAHEDLFDAKADLINNKVPATQLPVADGTNAGIINPSSKTEVMLYEVGVDANGKLWGQGGGGTDIHTLPTEDSIVDADELMYYRIASSAPKKTTWSNLKTKITSSLNLTEVATTNDGSDVTVDFESSATRTAISTGEKLSVLFGKVAKWFTDFGALAFKSNATGNVTAAGTISQPTFTGATLSSTGSYTPSGTNSAPVISAAVDANGNLTFTASAPTFAGAPETITTTGTPSGTVSQPTFTGSAVEVTVS